MDLTRSIRLASAATAPRLAREWVAALCDGLSPAERADVLLLTSELVTNAVRHPQPVAREEPHVRVDLLRTDEVVRVQVHDHDGQVLPPTTPAFPGQVEPLEGQMGLPMVATIASAWGARRVETGKIVWFEVPVSVRPPVEGSDAGAGLVQLAEPDAEAARGLGEAPPPGTAPTEPAP